MYTCNFSNRHKKLTNADMSDVWGIQFQEIFCPFESMKHKRNFPMYILFSSYFENKFPARRKYFAWINYRTRRSCESTDRRP